MNSQPTQAKGSRLSYGKKLSIQYYIMLTLTVVAALASWDHNLWLAVTMVVSTMLVVVNLKRASRQRSKGLHQTIRELASGIEQVASAASQVSSSAQSVAQGASQQAESLQETSASTEQITAMTNKNADSSRTVVETMQITAGRIDNGNHKLEEMVQSMNQITGSSEKISKIIKTIDEIAFQTNILALNAAVEAARAGEAGMGFAVVADEVRNLAQRAAAAAKDTSTLIEESIDRTQVGSRCLDEMATALAGITTESEKVKTLVEEVSVGSQEQASGLKQIAGAIVSMEQLTQRTAASSEESASVGEELSAQAESLRGVVKELAKTMGAKLEDVSSGSKSNHGKKSPNGQFSGVR